MTVAVFAEVAVMDVSGDVETAVAAMADAAGVTFDASVRNHQISECCSAESEQYALFWWCLAEVSFSTNAGSLTTVNTAPAPPDSTV